MFLTASELAELTGRKHRSRQIDWLKARGWAHEVSDTGRVLVLRSYFEARMSGLTAVAVPVRPAHNWSALNHGSKAHR